MSFFKNDTDSNCDYIIYRAINFNLGLWELSTRRFKMELSHSWNIIFRWAFWTMLREMLK